jgi:tetratricopeptide (TPR) repeat protein
MKVDPRSFKGLSRFLAPSAGGPVADRAVAERLVTPEQLQECVAEQDRSGRPLDEILVARGYLKAQDVERLRAPAVPVEVIPWLSVPDRVLGHYVLVSLLGTGGMAEVWKAWDRSLGRWVAVKYLKREIGHPLQRIEREGRMAGQLSHPSIITIFERGMQDGRAFLVMPFVDGTPPRAPLPPREAARLVLEVARALTHAHEAGVIHRDVKPGNILVEAAGRVVLADFGLAILDDAVTSRWAMSGTPEYASPEQIRGDSLDVRTDLYSLGATLYHLLSGKPPFTGSGVDEITDKVLKEPPPPLVDVPKPLAAVVRRAMQRDRNLRHPSMAAFAGELETWLEGQRARTPGRKAWIAVAVVSALLSWGATLLILVHSQQQEERQRVLQLLRSGDRKLAVAERRRSDPAYGEGEFALLAREALVEFSLANRDSTPGDPEARLGMGRCQELLGDDRAAEEAYQDASPLPAAKSALKWLWGRRLLEHRQDRDWKAFILQKVDPPHPVRLYAQGEWAAVEGSRPGDRDDDLPGLLRGAAALELGHWDSALKHLEEALRRRPGSSTLLHYKGLALAGKGNREGAEAAFREALELAPKGWGLGAETRRLLEESARR